MKKIFLLTIISILAIFFLSPWLWIDNGEKIMENQLFRIEGTNAFTQRRSNCEKEDGFTLQIRWFPFGATAAHPCFYDLYIVTFWGKMIHSEVDISKEVILQKNSPMYSEYLLPIEHDQIEPAHESLDLFVNKKTEELKELFLARGEFEYLPPPSYSLKQPYLGGFFIGNEEYWLVETGREYQEQSGRDMVWWEATTEDTTDARYQLYKNGELVDDLTYIFSRPLCYGLDGFEGMIEDTHLINEKLTFQFLDGECMNNPKSNVFVQGKLVNEIYNTDESKYYFSLGTTEGFIGKKLNQEYIYIDGQPASMNFDSIITSSCCMSPRPYIRMFEDGTIFFLGTRNEQFYLGEIHSQISEAKTPKLKPEDKK